MTFSVVVMENDRPKVVGTVWAADECSAQAVAPAVVSEDRRSAISIQRAEDREIPLRIPQLEQAHFC